jgi:CheY-like chemotaxis protein
MLTIVVGKAVPGTRVVRVTDEAGVHREAGDASLLLVNRKMEPGYDDEDGNDYIRRLRQRYSTIPMMLVSNFAESQQQAVTDGARPGFGKAELNEEQTLTKLRDVLG